MIFAVFGERLFIRRAFRIAREGAEFQFLSIAGPVAVGIDFFETGDDFVHNRQFSFAEFIFFGLAQQRFHGWIGGNGLAIDVQILRAGFFVRSFLVAQVALPIFIVQLVFLADQIEKRLLRKAWNRTRAHQN